MAGSVNKVVLVGNVVADPEVRATQTGKQIANFRLATSETWKDKATGEAKSKAEYHNVAVFNDGLCRVVQNYVRKGTKLYVEGSLATRKWTDKLGNEKYTTEVVLQGFGGTLVLLDSKKAADDRMANCPEVEAANLWG
jgi:single-strand DNA-binding protein